jgi:ArsR family transcriptional regulator, arsenate/arsenite/antimonite-responsive transcriptional repressor
MALGIDWVAIMNRSTIEKISKALGDSTRLGIFESIAAGQRVSCAEIISSRVITPATVSHHLKILTEAGLILCQREGQFVYCQPVPERLAEYVRALEKFAPQKLRLRR